MIPAFKIKEISESISYNNVGGDSEYLPSKLFYKIILPLVIIVLACLAGIFL